MPFFVQKEAYQNLDMLRIFQYDIYFFLLTLILKMSEYPKITPAMYVTPMNCTAKSAGIREVSS